MAALPSAAGPSTHADALFAEGWAAYRDGRLTEAERAYHLALRARPGHERARFGLAMLAWWRDDYEAAIGRLRELIPVWPDEGLLHAILGGVLRAAGDRDGAEVAFRRAIALAPELPDAHVDLGELRLARGDFLRGWPGYEWRMRPPDYATAPAVVPLPRWDGTPLDGRALLVVAEQGLGDALMFARYLPMIGARGGRLVAECQRPLARLWEASFGRGSTLVVGESRPPCDAYTLTMSLAPLLGTDGVAAIPPAAPCLRVPPRMVAVWRRRLRAGGPGLTVGLVWSASPSRARPGGIGPRNHRRSLPLAALAPLGRVPGVRLFSVQKGPPSSEAAAPPGGLRLTDLGPDIGDFLDTAAIVGALDLLIVADTSVANLGGTLGRPTWVLLPEPCDWRWGIAGDRTPWFPSARLFRQETPGDWGPVVERVAAELAALVKERGASR